MSYLLTCILDRHTVRSLLLEAQAHCLLQLCDLGT